MDPRDFQELAGKLVFGTRPAEIRTAISRSYYSVFNVGVALLKEMGFSVSKGSNAHGDVEHKLGNSGNIEIEKVGNQLASLRSKRIEADYRLNKTNIENRKTAQALVLQAKRMIQTLDTFVSGSEKKKIKKSIQEYIEKISYNPSTTP